MVQRNIMRTLVVALICIATNGWTQQPEVPTDTSAATQPLAQNTPANDQSEIQSVALVQDESQAEPANQTQPSPNTTSQPEPANEAQPPANQPEPTPSTPSEPPAAGSPPETPTQPAPAPGSGQEPTSPSDIDIPDDPTPAQPTPSAKPAAKPCEIWYFDHCGRVIVRPAAPVRVYYPSTYNCRPTWCYPCQPYYCQPYYYGW